MCHCNCNNCNATICPMGDDDCASCITYDIDDLTKRIEDINTILTKLREMEITSFDDSVYFEKMLTNRRLTHIDTKRLLEQQLKRR